MATAFYHSSQTGNHGILDNQYSEDEDYDPSGDEDDGFTFKTAVKLPHSEVSKKKLGELVELIEAGWIDLDPEYQRDVVWTPKAMAGLVNSVLEDFYIPPIIFNCHILTQSNGTRLWKRICVDGEQRLSSVRAFMKGQIPCHDKHQRPWFWCEDTRPTAKRSRTSRRILPVDIKSEFKSKTFVCYEYLDLPADLEEDLFARVQKGVELKPSEKIRASSGPFQSLAKLYEQDFPDVVNLASSDRCSGFRNVLAIFGQILEVQRPSNPNGSPVARFAPAAIRSLCSNPQQCTEATKAHFCRTFQTFQDLVRRDPSTFAGNNVQGGERANAIEVIASAVLISRYQDTRSSQQLLDDIKEMRSGVRAKLTAVRLHWSTWKPFWDFIKDLESIRGPGNLERPIEQAWPSFTTQAFRKRQPMPPPIDPSGQDPSTTSAHSSTRSSTERMRSSVSVAPTASSRPSVHQSPRQEHYTLDQEDSQRTGAMDRGFPPFLVPTRPMSATSPAFSAPSPYDPSFSPSSNVSTPSQEYFDVMKRRSSQNFGGSASSGSAREYLAKRQKLAEVKREK